MATNGIMASAFRRIIAAGKVSWPHSNDGLAGVNNLIRLARRISVGVATAVLQPVSAKMTSWRVGVRIYYLCIVVSRRVGIAKLTQKRLV